MNDTRDTPLLNALAHAPDRDERPPASVRVALQAAAREAAHQSQRGDAPPRLRQRPAALGRAWAAMGQWWGAAAGHDRGWRILGAVGGLSGVALLALVVVRSPHRDDVPAVTMAATEVATGSVAATASAAEVVAVAAAPTTAPVAMSKQSAATPTRPSPVPAPARARATPPGSADTVAAKVAAPSASPAAEPAATVVATADAAPTPRMPAAPPADTDRAAGLTAAAGPGLLGRSEAAKATAPPWPRPLALLAASLNATSLSTLHDRLGEASIGWTIAPPGGVDQPMSAAMQDWWRTLLRATAGQWQLVPTPNSPTPGARWIVSAPGGTQFSVQRHGDQWQLIGEAPARTDAAPTLWLAPATPDLPPPPSR